MKIEIDLNFNLKNLAGIDIPDNAGKLLGNVLVATSKGDALKYYDWGRILYKGDPITVDLSDFKHIYDFVKNSENITNLGKAQIIMSLDESEKASKENILKEDKK